MSGVRFRFKLTLIGEGAVGKTSIRQKYMGRGFTGEYLKTIGADFASKTVEITDTSGDVVKSIFQIWDLAGQVEFKAVRASFYGGCQGVLLVFDLTRKETMDKLKDIMSDKPVLIDVRGIFSATEAAEKGLVYRSL